MELIDNFEETLWRKGVCNLNDGFGEYRIIRAWQRKGFFEYAVFDNDGGMQKYQLYGSSSATYDPLKGIGNVFLKLDEQNETVTGIIVEDECVLKIGSNAEREQEECLKEQEAKQNSAPVVNAQSNGGSHNATEIDDEEEVKLQPGSVFQRSSPNRIESSFKESSPPEVRLQTGFRSGSPEEVRLQSGSVFRQSSPEEVRLQSGSAFRKSSPEEPRLQSGSAFRRSEPQSVRIATSSNIRRTAGHCPTCTCQRD